MNVAQDVKRILAGGNSLGAMKIRTMREAALDSTSRQSFNVLLLAVFAGIAVLLAAVGVYGVMSYTVEQRTPEFGIRQALGASRRNAMSLVLRESLRTSIAGIVPGVLASFGFARLLRAELFGVTPSDPLTTIVVPVFLAAIALAGAFFPARRAASVDPAAALRHS